MGSAFTPSRGVHPPIVHINPSQNLGDLHKSFCESDVDMLDDGLKILNECSENLRGRTEYPLTRFNAEHYQGNVKQNSRAPWIFYVKDIERQKRRGDKEEHKKGRAFVPTDVLARIAKESDVSPQDRTCLSSYLQNLGGLYHESLF